MVLVWASFGWMIFCAVEMRRLCWIAQMVESELITASTVKMPASYALVSENEKLSTHNNYSI